MNNTKQPNQKKIKVPKSKSTRENQFERVSETQSSGQNSNPSYESERETIETKHRLPKDASGMKRPTRAAQDPARAPAVKAGSGFYEFIRE